MEGILTIFLAVLALVNAAAFRDDDLDPDCPFPEGPMVVFYPYIYDCTKFYECSQGKKVLQDCPAGLDWDVSLNSCVFPYQTNCSQVVRSSVAHSEPRSVPRAAPTGNKTANLDDDHDPDCPFPDKGTPVYYPYIYDCSKFYECSQGKKVLQNCPPGLDWDVYRLTCVYPYQTDCSQVVSSSVVPTIPTIVPTPITAVPTAPTAAPTAVPTASPTAAPTAAPTATPTAAPTAHTTADPSNLCENQANGTYLPYPGDKNKYIECNFHHIIVYTCPGGTWWDQSILNCA